MLNLTPKQEIFLTEYLNMHNATAAYKVAYNCENMTEKTIGNNAYILKNHKGIVAKMKELKKPVAKNLGITIEYITEELKYAIAIAKKKKDPNNIIKGCDSLSKLHGLNKESDTNEFIKQAQAMSIVQRFMERQKTIDVTPDVKEIEGEVQTR